MEIFYTSYSVWKEVAQTNLLSVYFFDQGSNSGLAWCGKGEHAYETKITSSDWSDFDTNFPSGTRIAVSQKDDALASITGLDNLPAGQVVSPTYAHIDEAARFQGFMVTGSGIDTDTFIDHKITNQIYVHGGWFWSQGGELGDYAEFSVVDKDDVLGYFQYFGLTPGSGVIELGKYVEKCYLNPDGTDMCHLETPTIAAVASGLYMRTKVHTTGETPLSLGVTYLWFEV